MNPFVFDAAGGRNETLAACFVEVRSLSSVKALVIFEMTAGDGTLVAFSEGVRSFASVDSPML